MTIGEFKEEGLLAAKAAAIEAEVSKADAAGVTPTNGTGPLPLA